MDRTRRLGLLLLLLGTCCLLSRAGAGGVEEPPGARPEAGTTLDFRVPALETFAGWPPDRLRETGYWLPWSRPAFQRATLFGRPVFFVLTVNWSRAAERLGREVLADAAVLRAINAGYVSIRVNADLRPDLRERYGTATWPTVAFLLPNGQPMLSQVQERDLGVAKPITTSAVDPVAMRFLVEQGTVYWSKWTDLLLEVGQKWAEREVRREPGAGRADEQASAALARELLANADRTNGGFGAAPTFVVPALAEYAALLGARGLVELGEHSRLTLERLVASPLFDAVDGGVHRLASAPGFQQLEYEKLLEVNAALVRDLTFALRVADSAPLREALGSTAGFIARVLARPGGGFYLAQVADPTTPDGGGYWNTEGPRGAPPPVDPLVLSGPNAMAGAALVRAGLLLEREELAAAGRAALNLVLERGYHPGRGVLHAIEPAGDLEGIYLVTQASAALGFADGYEACGDPRLVDAAQDIVDFTLANLRHEGETALRDQLEQPQPIGLVADPRWPMRANVRLARVMLRLAWYGRGESYREQALALLARFSRELAAYGVHGTEAALALEEGTHEPLRIRVAGPPEAPAARELRRAALASPWPWTVVLGVPAAGDRVSAELLLGNTSKRVDRPSALHDAVAKLTASKGTGR